MLGAELEPGMVTNGCSKKDSEDLLGKGDGIFVDMNSDQIKGKIKEAAGVLTDNEKLENEGKADQIAGDAKNVVKDVAGKAEDVIDDIKQTVEKN